MLAPGSCPPLAFRFKTSAIYFQKIRYALLVPRGFEPDLFRTSNERGLLCLVHFLLTSLRKRKGEEECFAAVARAWPFHDRREQSAFKRASQAALMALVARGDLPPDCARASVLSTARSPR